VDISGHLDDAYRRSVDTDHAIGTANADWVTVVGGIATIDVRATIETCDGAFIYVQYRGRTAASRGVGAEPAYTTPIFETGDDYRWAQRRAGCRREPAQ
jgi:hypothetical protein